MENINNQADNEEAQMKTFTSSELKQTLSDHVDWLNNNGGERADLSSADLSYADLRHAENSDTVRYGAVTAIFALQCPEEGSFIGWKKARKKSIVKLRIPAKAKRSSATTRKCRASEAKVLAIFDREGKKIEVTTSNYDDAFEYKVGEIVSVEHFDENRWEECASGIHFFITRKEAEQY